jgi:hypothetical protein
MFYLTIFTNWLQSKTASIAAQRLALPAAGGTRLTYETDKIQSHEKSQFGGAIPAVRVHAVLGSF